MGKLKLNKEQKKFLEKNYKNSKDIASLAKAFAKKFNLEYTDTLRRTTSKRLRSLGLESDIKSEEAEKVFKEASKRKHTKSKNNYIFTWCQNQTKIHNKFFDNILAYADSIDAEVFVILGRYENPTAFSNTEKIKANEHWDKRVLPYADAARHKIHKHVTVLSDVKTQPTATYPLTGFQGIAGESTAILGHPKLHMKSLPVLEGRPHQILLTTGAVSLPNYSDTKAGKKAEFKHKFGFVIVETHGRDFYIRQVEAKKDGSFIDLNKSVNDKKVRTIKSIKALVMGDTHERFLDKEVHKTRMEKLVVNLKPSVIVQHDLMDGDSVNHHERKDPFKQFEKYSTGRNLIKKEMEEVLSFLKTLKPYNVMVVRSNHDDFLDRYLRDVDWKKDIPNALEYMEYSKIILSGQAPKGILPYVIEQHFGDTVRCLDRDESVIIGGYELGQHGDVGANGSRGSLRQFAKMSTPCVVGHSHTPERIDDAFQVGVATKLRLDYTKGASSWLNADCIIHDNDTAQHIIYINKDFTQLF